MRVCFFIANFGDDEISAEVEVAERIIWLSGALDGQHLRLPSWTGAFLKAAAA